MSVKWLCCCYNFTYTRCNARIIHRMNECICTLLHTAKMLKRYISPYSVCFFHGNVKFSRRNTSAKIVGVFGSCRYKLVPEKKSFLVCLGRERNMKKVSMKGKDYIDLKWCDRVSLNLIKQSTQRMDRITNDCSVGIKQGNNLQAILYKQMCIVIVKYICLILKVAELKLLLHARLVIIFFKYM